MTLWIRIILWLCGSWSLPNNTRKHHRASAFSTVSNLHNSPINRIFLTFVSKLFWSFFLNWNIFKLDFVTILVSWEGIWNWIEFLLKIKCSLSRVSTVHGHLVPGHPAIAVPDLDRSSAPNTHWLFSARGKIKSLIWSDVLSLQAGHGACRVWIFSLSISHLPRHTPLILRSRGLYDHWSSLDHLSGWGV